MAEASGKQHVVEMPVANPPEEPHLPIMHLDPSARTPAERSAREDTELARMRTNNYTAASSYRQQSPSRSLISKAPETLLECLTYNTKAFWRRQISVTVAHSTCRDHLALERTFLGYLRTSLALSMLGTIVAQLFRIQHAPVPNSQFGFFVLGKPLAFICQGTAIYVMLIGAFRTWRLQNAIVRGKAITGGYEFVALAGGILIILILFTVLLVAVDITKEI
ncbi:unnamed protein product [Diplocarpon coronariae]|uniref:DUF202 domain-containing protein n=1 Tax=Diplocarpon coronariae TaxID=2795749 RepID=A0A218ZB18_9HELO|nr:hypothetical protein B2J93_7919 [Marssonina coronariae]